MTRLNGEQPTEGVSLAADEIRRWRDRRYRRQPDAAVCTEGEARRFIDEAGFCFLFPVPGLELPSLWEAINGRARAIPHHHYDPALSLAWDWKDSLPARRAVFYGKFLRQKPTFISLAMLPYFYALSDNYGELDDYLESYRDGRLSEEAKRIYEALLARGPLPTSILRRHAGLYGRENSTRFERALVELQTGLKIAKSGISDANRWKYCYEYDLFLRRFPECAAHAGQIKSPQAWRAIILQYLHLVLVSTPEKIAHLFGWDLARVQQALAGLVAEGRLALGRVEEHPGEVVLLGERPAPASSLSSP